MFNRKNRTFSKKTSANNNLQEEFKDYSVTATTANIHCKEQNMDSLSPTDLKLIQELQMKPQQHSFEAPEILDPWSANKSDSGKWHVVNRK